MRWSSFCASITAAPFGQIVRQRLFDVHVLAGRAGVDRDRHVPVVGRADHHGVDVLARQQLVIILRGRRPWHRPAFLPASRCLSHTSHTAAIRTPGTSASARINCWQRPPVPMQPTLIVSLAAKPRAVAV